MNPARIVAACRDGRRCGHGQTDAELLFDLFICDAGVVGDAALAGAAQLVENFARLAKREPVRPAQRRGDVLNDPPVLPRIARRIDRLVDLDDAAFDLRDRPFIFFLQRAGQHDVGMSGRVVEEEIDRHVELELLQHAGDEIVVRQRYQGIEAD